MRRPRSGSSLRTRRAPSAAQPAIVVAGALGVHLGLAGWRTVRGRRSRATLADELERAFWVLVDLGAILLLAGFVEGFVSPHYYRLLL